MAAKQLEVAVGSSDDEDETMVEEEEEEEDIEAEVVKKNPKKRGRKSASVKKIHKCSHCDYVAKETTRLKTHLIIKHNIGTKNFVCTECGKRYCTNDRLKEHIRGHLNVYKYVCEKCGGGFLRPSRLKNHAEKCNGVPSQKPVIHSLDDSGLDVFITRENSAGEAEQAVDSISDSQPSRDVHNRSLSNGSHNHSFSRNNKTTPQTTPSLSQYRANYHASIATETISRVEEAAQNANMALRRVEESALDATTTLRRIEETSLNATSQLRQVEESAINAHSILRKGEDIALNATASLRRVEESALNATTILRRVEDSTFNSTSDLRKAEDKLKEAAHKLSQFDPCKDDVARAHMKKLDGEVEQVRGDIGELRNNQLEIMQKLHALEQLLTEIKTKE